MAPSKKAPAKQAAVKKAAPAGKAVAKKTAAKKTARPARRAVPAAREFYKADLSHGKGGLEVSATDDRQVRRTATLRQAFENGSELRFTVKKPAAVAQAAAAAPAPMQEVADFLQGLGDASLDFEITCIE